MTGDLVTGGCQCGQCRYEVDRDAIATLYACHCKECQRQAGSAFGMSMLMPSSALRFTRGTLKSWRRPSNSGNAVECHFCPEIGLANDRMIVSHNRKDIRVLQNNQ